MNDSNPSCHLVTLSPLRRAIVIIKSMTLSLKCTCGVRLDIPENFAGQQITCPDCQHPVAVPRNDPALIKTSGLALTSLMLALVGAFTVVGTALAVVFGVLALIHLRHRPDAITGKRYAIAGIVLGVVLTATTLAAYSSVEQFGLPHLMGQSVLVQQTGLRWAENHPSANEENFSDRPAVGTLGLPQRASSEGRARQCPGGPQH